MDLSKRFSKTLTLSPTRRTSMTRQLLPSDFAEYIGITEANLSLLKQGKVKGVRFDTLQRICEYLGCQPADLLVSQPDELPPQALIGPRGSPDPASLMAASTWPTSHARERNWNGLPTPRGRTIAWSSPKFGARRRLRRRPVVFHHPPCLRELRSIPPSGCCF